jgi:hypothetical protein
VQGDFLGSTHSRGIMLNAAYYYLDLEPKGARRGEPSTEALGAPARRYAG